MACKKYYTTEELIQLVEDEDFWEGDVFITPPTDGAESEEDSGDEDECNDINKLSGRQLQAEAVARLKNREGTVTIGDESGEEENDQEETEIQIENNETNDGYISEDNVPLAELKKKKPKTYTRNWKNSADLNCNLPPFVSPRQLPSIPEDAVECFELFFDENVFNFLTEMTNKYGKKKDPTFHVKVEEIRCFVALLLLSGYCIVPRWRMWWEIGTETCNMSVVNSMRRNRFEVIKRYLHCADNDNLPPNDKFGKMRPLMNMLNERFLQYAEFQEKLSIDESMVPYFGRHGAKQFLKGKPIRYGYKMWCLCEPLGYLMKFEPYQGKIKPAEVTATANTAIAGSSKTKNKKNTGLSKSKQNDLGVGGNVVLELLKDLPENVSFKIYGDRFFSSLKLVNYLQEKAIGYTGTIKYNRIENCPAIMSSKLVEKKPRGFYDFCTDEKNNVTVTSWHDNRIVLTVSTCDPTLPEGNVDRWVSAEKKKMPVSQPFVVSQYNKYMGGVDRLDQNVENYRISIRSKKWWWSIFAYCVDISIHNGWQLYRKSNGKKMDLLRFRRTIVQTYLKKHGVPGKGGGRPVTHKEICSRVPDQVRFDRNDHWLVTAEKQNRCAICKKNTTKACGKCGVNCHEGCFLLFHTK